MIDLSDLISEALNSGADLPQSAVIDSVNADGTVDLQYLGGLALSVPVVGSYTPSSGDVVQVMRRGPSSLLVLGPVRVTNATSTKVRTDLTVVYNVGPVPSAESDTKGTYTIYASNSGAYRSADGWGSRNDVLQGAYTPRYGYYRGCWFYGATAFDKLKGRTVKRIRISLKRKIGSGVYAAEPISIWTHKNATKPKGAPYLVSKIATVRLAVEDSGTFDLPVSAGQALANGSVKGFAIRDDSTGNYLALYGENAWKDSGKLTIDWED